MSVPLRRYSKIIVKRISSKFLHYSENEQIKTLHKKKITIDQIIKYDKFFENIQNTAICELELN